MSEGVAVIGMAGRFSGAPGIEEFWCNLERGVEMISDLTDAELEPSRLETPGIRSLPNYVKARGILEDADKFDASFFGITPREASLMDPQQRVFLEQSWAALENAGYDPDLYRGSIGVWAGSGANTYFLENVLPRGDLAAAEQIAGSPVMLANERDYLTTRVSYKLNLRGPSVSVSTACSTSLVAVCQAYHALVGHQCDIALAGGVFVNVPQRRGYLYREGSIGSPDGRCRPFDAEAAGTVFSDGVGIVVLKRLAEALEDGDTVYAVIKGVAVNNDGSGRVSFTAPSIDGQAEVVALAQALADVSPETISYVEAHGTATPLGDPIEIAALTQAFRAGTAATGFCAIGSVKGNVGHLDAAAGVAGLIKTVLALHHRRLPPTLHFKSPNPRIDFADSPFYVVTALTPWPAAAGPRRAGVSAFGVGGTNAHVVLEEAPATSGVTPSRTEQLLVLSARTQRALDEAARRLGLHLREHPGAELADVAYTLQVGRRAFGFRRAIVCRDTSEAAEALLEGGLKRALHGVQPRSDATVAFVFPGQGAQHVGMARGLYLSEATFRAELDACAEALLPHLGVDIRSLIFAAPAARDGAERRLAEASISQPALFAVEYALACLWMAWGITPAAMIGHSLGEYVAACLAGVLSRDAAASVVAARGRLVQEQPRGAMLAVLMSAVDLEPRLSPGVTIAGLDAPELTVVSGPEDAVRALESKLGEDGVGCRVLATSHAFHSALMDGALAQFRDVLGQVRLEPPRRPWISCLTGDWVSPTQAVDPEYWVQQMRQPVRFSDGVRRLARTPSQVLLEVGPGRTLSGLVGQHRNRPAEQGVIASLGADPEQDVSSLLEALGRLWIAGVKPDWSAVHGGERRRRVPLPTYPFERKRFWVDASPLPEQDATLTRVSGVETAPAAWGDVDRRLGPGKPGPAPTDSAHESLVMERLRVILSAASGIPRAEIDAARSFVELGFDSLLLTQVSGALEKDFGAAITLRQLLEEFPTLDALTTHIEVSLDRHSAPGVFPTPATAGGIAVGSHDAVAPPVPGARLGRDAGGDDAWFVPDPDRPGKYLQVSEK
jgi:acyl transferase domain-containing protein/acyl carrier protein